MKNDEILNKLPKQFTLKNGAQLVLDEKPHQGTGNLSDIVWYQYKIINCGKLGIGYDNVCLSPTRITESVRVEASKNIFKDGVSKKETVRPHIDRSSGNIHPSKEYVSEQNNGEIHQLVLCNGLGPHTPVKQVDDDYYVYKNTPRQAGAKVHKACYYPLIDDGLNLKNDWRYQLLEEVWDKINNLSLPSEK